MTMNIRPTHCPQRRNPLPHAASWSRRATRASEDLEFGRFRVLLGRTAARRRCWGRTRNARLRSPAGPIGGRRLARHERGDHEPGLAERRRLGRKRQVSGRCVAQSTRCRPRRHPYGSRPQLPIHWCTALGCGGVPWPPPHAIKSAVWPDFSKQSCPQLLCAVSGRQEVSDFSSQAQRTAHAPARVRIFQAYPARAKRFAKRRYLDSRTPPVEGNH
jgi:hypothetical protein